MSMRHGADTAPVPPEWRGHPRLSPTSIYGLSSLNYSLTGLLILLLLRQRPERSFYALEKAEACLWIWQGIISFKCDALDLGVDSWSHPADRVSATLFILQQTLKFCFVSCEGSLGRPLLYAMYAGLAAGGWCFHCSSVACRNRLQEAYRFWHIAWHLAFPVTMALFHLAVYHAPAHAVHCVISGL